MAKYMVKMKVLSANAELTGAPLLRVRVERIVGRAHDCTMNAS